MIIFEILSYCLCQKIMPTHIRDNDRKFTNCSLFLSTYLLYSTKLHHLSFKPKAKYIFLIQFNRLFFWNITSFQHFLYFPHSNTPHLLLQSVLLKPVSYLIEVNSLIKPFLPESCQINKAFPLLVDLVNALLDFICAEIACRNEIIAYL